MGRCDYDLFMDCPTVVLCCLQLFSLKTRECKLATIFTLMRINVILLDYAHVLFIFCYKNRLLWGQTAGEKWSLLSFVSCWLDKSSLYIGTLRVQKKLCPHCYKEHIICVLCA